MLDPKTMVMNFISKNANPMFSNLIGMANSNNKKGIEDFARNICNQRGINYEDEFSKFMNQFTNNQKR